LKIERKFFEAVGVIYALRRLPSSFNVFQTLQFAKFKDDENIEMDKFMEELETEVRRQCESQAIITSTSTAMAVSQQPAVPSTQKKKGRKPYCSGGVHNPETSHSEENCHQIHPEKAIAYHQAAIDRVTGKSNPRANLGTKSSLQDGIILDSGVSSHFLKHRSYFHSLLTLSSSVFGANGAAIPILGFGPATIQTSLGPLNLSLAYYSPGFSNSLLLLTHYIRLGYSLHPTANGTRFECRRGSNVILTGHTRENVLLIDMNPLKALSITNMDPIDIHRALGHPSLPYLTKAFPNVKVKSIDCNVCDCTKMHCQPFGVTFPTFNAPLDCVHMDLCGPITPASRGGNRYFLKIIDGFTKYRFIYPMRCKSDTFHFFKIFLSQAETFTNHRLKMVVSDNGGEFCNKQFSALYQQRGIQHLTSSPYPPQQNPLAERGNRTTVEKTRALLLTSGLLLDWWGKAVVLSVFLENRSPDSSINFSTPYEMWHGKKPDLTRLVPFGCRAVVFEEQHFHDFKFSPSSLEAIFVGYDGSHHSFKVWVPSTNKLVTSHHVKL
jgi:transposase InsO family protein